MTQKQYTDKNGLSKLFQLLKSKVDGLSTTINAKPSIDDTTGAIDKVYSSSKIEQLIASGAKFTYEKLTIQPTEWYQNGSSNEWKYNHRVQGLSTDKCLYPVVSNGMPLGTSDFDMITYTNVTSGISGHTFALTTIGKPSVEIEVNVLYFEIDKSYAQDLGGSDYYMYGTILKEPIDLTSLIDDDSASENTVYSSSKVDELISNKIVTIALKIGYAEWQQDVYDNYYVEKDLSDQLAQYSFSSSNFSMMVNIDESSAVSPIWSNIKVSRVGNILRFESSVAIEYTTTVFVEVWENKLEGEQPLYAFKKNTGDLINDTTPSEETVYSSSKIEELLASGGGQSNLKTIYTDSIDPSSWTSDGTYFKTQMTLQTPYSDNMSCIVDLALSDSARVSTDTLDREIADYSKIKFGKIVEDMGYAFLDLYATEQPSGDLYLKFIRPQISASNISTLATGDDSDDSDEPDVPAQLSPLYDVFLISRAPVSSGSSGSTVYEFNPNITLTNFIESGMYYGLPFRVELDLSQYGIVVDENKKAIITPSTYNDKPYTLRYTECYSDGTIYCHFTENPTSYDIKSIEITPIKIETIITSSSGGGSQVG